MPDGTIRARLPAPARTAREFRPGHLAEAEAWLDAALHPATETTPIAVTVRDWVGYWHRTYVAPIRPPSTARRYLYALQQLASLYGTPLLDLRASALQGVVGQLSQRVGAATLGSIVGVWQRSFEAAIDDELIARNPAKRLTLPRVPPRTVKRHVTPAEVAALWPAIIGQRCEAAFALLLGCGLRIGEVLGLHWSDVDLAGSCAWIGPQWTGSQWRPLPKSRNPHWIPLPARVVAALIRHRNRQPPGTVLVMQSPYGRKGRRGRDKPAEPQPYSGAVVGRDLAALCADLGLDRLTSHTGRRGLVTVLLDGGASPAEVAARVGHVNPGTTLRSYAGQSGEARQKADDLVRTYLGDDAPGDVSSTDIA